MTVSLSHSVDKAESYGLVYKEEAPAKAREKTDRRIKTIATHNITVQCF
jgi:hypothetical protein